MIHILVHDTRDTVGVAVVEGIKAGQDLTGWVMEGDSTIKVKALNDCRSATKSRPAKSRRATRSSITGSTLARRSPISRWASTLMCTTSRRSAGSLK